MEKTPEFQDLVGGWMFSCFGKEISDDKTERAYRFLEEALELVQAGGHCSVEDAHRLVDYVYGRPVGDLAQEVGGVAVTLAAFCNTHNINTSRAALAELPRCWRNIDKIREKQRNKPQRSPLPQ